MISQITLSNFKAFIHQDFSIGNLTLLTGVNGSGKSSVMQALLLLRQSWDQTLLHDGRVSLNGEYTSLGRFQEVLNESADGEYIGISVLGDTGGNLEFEISFIDRDSRIGRSQTSLTAEAVMHPLLADGFCYLAAERIGPRVHYNVRDRQLPSAGIGINGEGAMHLLQLNADSLLPNPACAHAGARSGNLLHQVEAWMGEISPGIQLHLNSQPSLDLVQAAYSFVGQRNTSGQFRPTNIGFGVSYTLPVVTAILGASPGDLLLIESPEAHLHPKGQTKLTELICLAASSGVQIIVESHSDHVLNAIRNAVRRSQLNSEDTKVYFFAWPSGRALGSTTAQEVIIDKNGRVEFWPPDFFDEIDKSLELLLTPKATT
jgi:predicted ATPase